MRTKLVAPALAALLLVGCGDDASEPEGDRAPTPSSVSAAPTADAVDAAENFLRLWARPHLDYKEWWQDLKPLLNAAGRQAYSATDPAVVPTLDITGSSEITASPVDTFARVNVPTNEGMFVVQLQRPDAREDWLVTRLWFPGDTPPDV